MGAAVEFHRDATQLFLYNFEIRLPVTTSNWVPAWVSRVSCPAARVMLCPKAKLNMVCTRKRIADPIRVSISARVINHVIWPVTRTSGVAEWRVVEGNEHHNIRTECARFDTACNPE